MHASVIPPKCYRRRAVNSPASGGSLPPRHSFSLSPAYEVSRITYVCKQKFKSVPIMCLSPSPGSSLKKLRGPNADFQFLTPIKQYSRVDSPDAGMHVL